LKKISEIKIIKTVHRPVFDEYGNRYTEERQFIMKYNPCEESNVNRAFAKLIDLVIFYIPISFFIYEGPLKLLFSTILVINYGATLEYLYGTTLGKLIFNLRVVDDNGTKPNFKTSIKRNLLAPFNLLPDFQTFRFPDVNRETKYDMNLNNRICKTYVVRKEKLKEIEELQLKEEPELAE
jgi:uncharacterized RDD family membrane protein YckC